MKIKVKKEMRLDELIKWAWDNPGLATGRNFYPQTKSDIDYKCFSLYDGRNCIIKGFVSADDTFEVEFEEDITEETKVDRLIELFEIQEGDYNSTLYENTSIKECLYGRCVPTKAFYILNDDLTMTLIWKDRELVE
ncbi:hypothetical protein [Staphylococcus aureus]|uniref:hypothetical protein n=1 Tax=Staphylococcus aureus TaxID=1280 RepID=UPI00226A6908|nr:hypothetical protein [Staphylococcus aureus]WAA07459.1 hypothetical protein M1F52_01745 [Staphylococcus aureus]HCQ3456101.1 hypothetical protein [Staphylococcus aureus]HCQ3458953.1 hypothetical protein [Staphylococcus aureus]HDE4087171.1 hypothetical protein [Staphylococcus aureus]HDE8125825.1 hypothetical protein [Staphylococcus aureus]